MWSAEEMPKPKENQQEGENTPRDEREQSGHVAAGASSVDAGADQNMFKEGDSVICLAKKMKHLYDGQTATIVRVMMKDRVKINMTSGGKNTRFVLWMRTVSARTRRRGRRRPAGLRTPRRSSTTRHEPGSP